MTMASRTRLSVICLLCILPLAARAAHVIPYSLPSGGQYVIPAFSRGTVTEGGVLYNVLEYEVQFINAAFRVTWDVADELERRSVHVDSPDSGVMSRVETRRDRTVYSLLMIMNDYLHAVKVTFRISPENPAENWYSDSYTVALILAKPFEAETFPSPQEFYVTKMAPQQVRCSSNKPATITAEVWSLHQHEHSFAVTFLKSEDPLTRNVVSKPQNEDTEQDIDGVNVVVTKEETSMGNAAVTKYAITVTVARSGLVRIVIENGWAITTMETEALGEGMETWLDGHNTRVWFPYSHLDPPNVIRADAGDRFGVGCWGLGPGITPDKLQLTKDGVELTGVVGTYMFNGYADVGYKVDGTEEGTYECSLRGDNSVPPDTLTIIRSDD